MLSYDQFEELFAKQVIMCTTIPGSSHNNNTKVFT